MTKSKSTSSSLKQQNKKHKGKGIGGVVSQGRSNKNTRISSKKSTHILSKKERKLQAKQIKLQKKKVVADSIQSRGGKDSAPLFCALIPLSPSCTPHLAQTLLKTCDQESHILPNITSIKTSYKTSACPVTIESKRLKKCVTFATAKYGDLFGCLDLAKVADYVVLLCTPDVDFDDAYVSQLLLCLYSQGIQSLCYGVMSNCGDIKDIKSEVHRRYADVDVRRLNSTSDALVLLRHLCLSTGSSHRAASVSSVYRQRTGMLVEQLETKPNPNKGGVSLCISGCLKGRPLNMNSSVHLTGWGDFFLSRVLSIESGAVLGVSDPAIRDVEMVDEDVDDVGGSGDENFSNDDDSDEDMEDGLEKMSDGDDVDSMNGDIGGEAKSDGEDIGSDASDDSGEKRVRFASGTKSEFSMATTSAFSAAQLAKFREARSEEQFPDEVETPVSLPARHRFAKYRGLAGFRSSEWSKDEDIPDEYRKIHMFGKYHHDRNRLMNQLHKGLLDKEGCVLPGTRVTLELEEVTPGLAQRLVDVHSTSGQPLVAFSLLRFEEKRSVVHFTLRRISSARVALEEASKAAEAVANDPQDIDSRTVLPVNLPPEAEPIKSKDPMMFQAGFRRYQACPIYSELNTGSDKFKMMRFFPGSTSACVASMYAPVMYTPVPVLQFRIRGLEQDAEVKKAELGELVATGSLLTVNPDRIILKRILLSGHPYKIHKKKCVVRFMFYNPDDILYFKPIELRTKYGRRGQIKEPVGTHGLMKCQFDKQLNAADVVLMPLYKRVFPKWSYSPDVHSLLPDAPSHLPSTQSEAAMDLF